MARESVKLADRVLRQRWPDRPRLPLATTGATAPDQRDLVHRQCLVDPVVSAVCAQQAESQQLGLSR